MFKENTRNLHTRTHTHTHTYRKFERGEGGRVKMRFWSCNKNPSKLRGWQIRTYARLCQCHNHTLKKYTYRHTHQSPRTHSTNTFRTSSSSFCQIYASRFCTSNVIVFVLLSMLLLLLLRLTLTISFLAFTK